MHATASSTIKQARLTRQAERKGTTLRLMLALGVQIWAASCPIRKHMSSDASKADARTPRHAVLLVPVGRPPQLLRARCVPEAVCGGCSAGQGCPFPLSLPLASRGATWADPAGQLVGPPQGRSTPGLHDLPQACIGYGQSAGSLTSQSWTAPLQAKAC